MGGWIIQIMTCMSRVSEHFHGHFRIPLLEQDVQEVKDIISFNFHCEFDGMSNVVEIEKLLQSCWSMWPNYQSIIDVSETFSGFAVCCKQ
jgi:hypothetical protein